MAGANVFGTPVTEGSRLERALRALNNPNEGNKRNQAVDYVRRQKQIFGNGVSTLCIFYNATGDALLYDDQDSWYGRVFDSYPVRVQNGQWGAFLHTKSPSVSSGSVAFVVYRVRNMDNVSVKQVLCWQTPWGQLLNNNQAYCDIFSDAAVIRPDAVYKAMADRNTRQHTVLKLGMFTSTIIETGTSPLYEAKLAIDDVSMKITFEGAEDASEKTSEDVGDASEKTSEDVEDASKKTSEDVEA